MSVEVLKAAPPPRPYRFELLPEDAMASALDLLDQPVEEEDTGEITGAVERGLRHALAFAAAQAEERRDALILLSELAPLSCARMKRRIVERRPRFRTSEFLGLIYDRCAEEVHHDPRRAKEFGRLAVLAAQNLDTSLLAGGVWHDVLAESLAVLADTERHAADLAGAEATFQEAESHLAAGSGTLLVRAGLLIRLASLHCDRERHETGLKAADQALVILRVGAEGPEIARALLVKGRLRMESGQSAAAVELFQEALELIEPTAERALATAAQHNLAAAWGELGRFEEARAPFDAAWRGVRLLARPLGQLRLRWLEARLAESRGEPEAAEAVLLEVHRELLRRRRRADAALAGHELAEIRAALGKRPARGFLDPLKALVSPRRGTMRARHVSHVADRSW